MFRPWRSFPLMVGAGLIVGLLTGGFPADASRIVQQVTLIAAMTASLTEISFRGLSPRAEARGLILAFLMSYGALGGLVLLFAVLSPDPETQIGWILVAAVPPAVGVVPITSFLRGDVRRALISDAVLYLLGLVMVPAVTLAFLGEGVDIGLLAQQTLLLIGLPVLISWPLRRWTGMPETRPTAVSVAFFFLVLAIAGSTRATLLARPDLVGGLSLEAALRTFGLGLLVFLGARAVRASRNGQIAAVTFGSFKNLGLTVVLAFTVFGAGASLPAIVCLIFEIAWMATLPFLFRIPAAGVTEIGE